MKKIKITILCILSALCALAAIACEFTHKVAVEEIAMRVGEYVDIADYADFDFDMSVSDQRVVSVISETVLYATAPGNTVVNITKGTFSHTINVKIEYAEPKLNISCDSPLYNSLKGETIGFTADLGLYGDGSEQVNWYVNGNMTGIGRIYSFLLYDYGRYEVTAKVRDDEQTLIVICDKSFDQSPQLTSDAKQAVAAGTEVNFSLHCEGSRIAPCIEWYINDELKQSGGEDLAFSPLYVGNYEVYALVNGISTNVISFTASGKAEIKNARFDFDSEYPDLYLKWDMLDGASYEVTVDGKAYEVGNTDRFDLGDMIDLGRSSEITLRCTGGEYFTASDPVVVHTPKLSTKALAYLGKSYFDGNYYMSSDKEVFDLVEYAMIFRPEAEQTDKGERIDLEFYMGYDSDMSAAMLLSKAWAQTEQTGSYRMRADGATNEGNVVNFEIFFMTSDEPDNFSTDGKQSYVSLLSPKFGGGMTSLPIDDRKSGGEVYTSDELCYVVQKGYSPEPTSGSAAERIYDKARRVIGNILSDDMTEERKVRAIFDWIMWNTVYDYSVVTYDVASAVRQPAFYAEGVFDTGYAVCDGIAKSMSLLCNMAGIPCIRVVGYADNGTLGRHAWNKVCIENEWYILDATWSDSRISLGNRTFEGALHDYYLKADCEMPTHIELYPQLYPRCDSFYDWYDKNGISVGDASEDSFSGALTHAIEDIAYEVKIGDDVTERDFYCMEIKLSQRAKIEYNFNRIKLDIIIRSILQENYTYIMTEDLILIMIVK